MRITILEDILSFKMYFKFTIMKKWYVLIILMSLAYAIMLNLGLSTQGNRNLGSVCEGIEID